MHICIVETKGKMEVMRDREMVEDWGGKKYTIHQTHIDVVLCDGTCQLVVREIKPYQLSQVAHLNRYSTYKSHNHKLNY